MLIKSKRKCKVCGYRFTLETGKVHVVHERQKISPLAMMTAAKTYDATDCPRCGCQMILAERLPGMPTKTNESNPNKGKGDGA